MYYLIPIIIGSIILLIVIVKFYISLSSGICKCDTKMDGKVIIITGANTGIGYEAARDLVARGAKVILACRSIEKGTSARDSIIKETGKNNVVFKQLDLCSLRSVRNFAEDIIKTEPKIDVLVNNAGTIQLDNSLTEDNLPIEAQINHFAPFLLTILLLPLIKKSAPSRIINVSSILHKCGKVDVNTFHKQATSCFGRNRVYSNTKLANVLFTNKLSEDLKGTGVTANSLHPGAVNTDIFRNSSAFTKFFTNMVYRTPWQGAQTIIHLAVAPKLKETTGQYYVDCRKSCTSRSAKDRELANKLWELSYRVTIENTVT